MPRDQIRAYVAEHVDAKPKEVAAALSLPRDGRTMHVLRSVLSKTRRTPAHLERTPSAPPSAPGAHPAGNGNFALPQGEVSRFEAPAEAPLEAPRGMEGGLKGEALRMFNVLSGLAANGGGFNSLQTVAETEGLTETEIQEIVTSADIRVKERLASGKNEVLKAYDYSRGDLIASYPHRLGPPYLVWLQQYLVTRGLTFIPGCELTDDFTYLIACDLMRDLSLVVNFLDMKWTDARIIFMYKPIRALERKYRSPPESPFELEMAICAQVQMILPTIESQIAMTLTKEPGEFNPNNYWTGAPRFQRDQAVARLARPAA